MKLKYNFDIILFGETKLKPKFPSNLYHLAGYNIYNCCRDAKNSGGGLLLFVRKDLIIFNVKKSSSTFEKIKFNLKTRSGDIRFICIYRQPTQNSYKDFIDELEIELASDDSTTFIIGDINLDANADNMDSLKYINLLRSYNYDISNTYKSRNASGRIIDHVCTNSLSKTSIRNYTIGNNISDHNMIITELNNMESRVTKQKLQFQKTNFPKLRDEFRNSVQKSNILNIECPNEITNVLLSMTKNSISCSSTCKTITIKQLPLCTWFNQNIAEAIYKKDKLAKKCRSNKNNVNYRLKLHVASSNLKEVIRREKFKYINNSIDSGNSKLIWRQINQLLGKKKEPTSSAIFNEENEIVSDEETVADMFNDFFANSVHELSSQIFPAAKSFHFPADSVADSFMLEPTDTDEVKQTIISLKNAAPGIDNISSFVIKEIVHDLSPILAHLINRIFTTGTYPDIFKIGLTVPLNKTGDKTNMADYRPITMLTTFNKVIEKILVKRLQAYSFDHTKIIYSHQFGFRPKCNTEIAAIELTQYIQNSIDNKKKVSVVSMDLRKAFDTVDVNKLLERLFCYGIRGTTHKLIKSYLFNRLQQVKIGNHISSSRPINQGVVQGSIIGPWLFSMFLNNMSSLKLEGKLFMYADDCVLLNSHDYDEVIETKVCKDMNLIINYLCRQRMVINMSKTNFMLCTSTQAKTQDTDKITLTPFDDDSVKLCIERVNKIKYLGLIIDEHLKWSEHIKHVESKVAGAAGILWKLKHDLPTVIKKRIYTALFESHLNYMLPVWGSASNAAIDSLQIMQNRALRNIYKLDRLHNRTSMYKEKVEQFLPIRAMFFVNTTVLIYKCIHQKIHTNLSFTIVNTESTRSDSYLRPMRARTLYGTRSIASIGPKMFNDVPKNIQNLHHVHSFRWNLKRHIRTEEFIQSCFTNDFLSKYS